MIRFFIYIDLLSRCRNLGGTEYIESTSEDSEGNVGQAIVIQLFYNCYILFHYRS